MTFPAVLARMPRAAMVFGFADGAVCASGIIAGLTVTHQTSHAVWTAALSAGLAEMAGMTAGQYQSAPEDGKMAALVCGAASTTGAVIPAIPYLLSGGNVALAFAMALMVVLCSAIAWLRPDHQGWRAFAQSYGILVVATGLCLLGGLIGT